MKEPVTGGKTYAKKKPGQYPKGGGKGLQGDALVGRVSQSTINDIKRMGMTKALRLAGENGKTAGGLAREFQEGVRRMYGADRLAAAKAKYSAAPASKKPDTSASSKSQPKPKTAAYAAGAAKPATSTTKTMYNRLTGEKITYKETPKAAPKPKAKPKPTPAAPKYNRYTQQKIK